MISTEFRMILLFALIIISGILDYLIRKEWHIFFPLLKKHDSQFVNQYDHFGPSIFERAALIFQLSFCGLSFQDAGAALISSVNKIRNLNRLRWFTLFLFVVFGFIYT